AIISDIHEDIINLRQIISRIEKKGFDSLVCLGDISGFSLPYYNYGKTRNAHECLNLLREKCDIILPGNHDFHAAQRIPESSAVFDFPSNWYELDFRKKYEMVNGEIWLHEMEDLDPLYRKEDVEFLNSLPEYYILETPGKNILFSHYAYPNLSGFSKSFYFKEREFQRHFGFMKERNCEISFMGHAHIGGFYLVTPGKFKNYRNRKLKLQGFPVCIGIQPVTSQNNISGFCIFDTESFELMAVRS
ncbi:MAG: metallophosphoesterase family protein, partial [Bacteroidota bacterium]